MGPRLLVNFICCLELVRLYSINMMLRLTPHAMSAVYFCAITAVNGLLMVLCYISLHVLWWFCCSFGVATNDGL